METVLSIVLLMSIPALSWFSWAQGKQEGQRKGLLEAAEVVERYMYISTSKEILAEIQKLATPSKRGKHRSLLHRRWQ